MKRMATLYFRYGAMNSSKSANLLMVNYNYTSADKETIIFKPALDTRDGDFVKSRVLEEKVPAVMIEKTEYGKMYSIVEREKPDAVLVDEVQFFNERQVKELADIVDDFDIPVLCYGLMADFTGHLFEGSKSLIENGARLEEVKTVCVHCERKAQYNMRLLDGEPTFHGEQVQVGGNESYQSVCRKCYNRSRQRIKEKEILDKHIV